MFKNKQVVISIILFALLGAALIGLSLASANTLNYEAESVSVNSSLVKQDSGASDGSYVKFETSQTDDQKHLLRILSSNTRNKNHDNSPHINTPSNQLPKEQLYGNPGDYRSINDLGATGNFRIACEFSHFAYDDPIVLPNKPGQAHLHMFFGNTHANAYSTYNSLIDSGSSTCNGGELNRTSYWVPAVIDGQGRAVVPKNILVYYKAYGGAVGSTVTYPEGMRFISGDAFATTRQPGTNSFREIFFRCFKEGTGGNNTINTKHVEIPNCPSTHVVEMNIKFQTCWNGNDPSNYKQNAAFSDNWPTSGSCPRSHSIRLPQMEYRIFFSQQGNSKNWFLSSDVDPSDGKTVRTHGWTIHGDWYGAWNKDINKAWIDNCLNIVGADCGDGLLADPDQPVYAKIQKH